MKKRAIFILIFTLFAIQSYSQSFSNVDTINVVLSASSFKTVTLAIGVKCITVDNSAESLDLKIGFSPHGSTVDTSNTYTVPAGRIYSFPDRINNYLYLKSGAASTIRLIVDYGAGLPYCDLTRLTKSDTLNTITENGLTKTDTLDIRNISDWVRVDGMNTDTVQSVPDTLSRQICPLDTSNSMVSRGVTCYWGYAIWASDTIEYSTDITFPASNTATLLPNDSWTNAKIWIGLHTNLYYRTKFTGGHTGSATVRKWAWGY